MTLIFASPTDFEKFATATGGEITLDQQTTQLGDPVQESAPGTRVAIEYAWPRQAQESLQQLAHTAGIMIQLADSLPSDWRSSANETADIQPT